jgi:hypothetical protein
MWLIVQPPAPLPRTRLQSIFTGRLSNQIVCMGGCGSIRTQPETYYCMSMQVQHKKNLLESLEHMVKVGLAPLCVAHVLGVPEGCSPLFCSVEWCHVVWCGVVERVFA